MASVFTRSNNATTTPSRNTFDGSFVNNLTLKAGVLTPCFCKEVIPGDSFKIDATFGFNFQPMVFPVQTDMECSLHFFYVRNRALWRGWQNFITKTDNKDGDTVPPYLMLTPDNRDMVDTGHIGDYLGIPSVFYGTGLIDINKYPITLQDWIRVPNGKVGIYSRTIQYSTYVSAYRDLSDRTTPFRGLIDVIDEGTNEDLSKVFDNVMVSRRVSYADGSGNFDFPADSSLVYTGYVPPVADSLIFSANTFINDMPFLYTTLMSNGSFFGSNAYTESVSSSSWYNIILLGIFDRTERKLLSYSLYTQSVKEGVGAPTIYLLRSYNYTGSVEIDLSSGSDGSFLFQIPDEHSDDLQFVAFNTAYIPEVILTTWNNVYSNVFYPSQNIDSSGGVYNNERDLEELPFASSLNEETVNSEKLHVSALPFRAYEAIYNSFYRDERNNPRIVDGQPLYNDWLTTDHGGADTTHYELYRRNWESDVFTTSVQSPQQGVLPLVGVTASGNMTFQDEEGKTYYLQATFDADGKTITGISSYSSDMPVGTLRAMVDTISTGISINDFRNVNALQRWLETNMRKGLRYKDQIEAHFGVSPTYSELDMPEFIGGMSRKVQMNRVVQTNSSEGGSPLGTLAGNATVLGSGGQSVSKFCDEHGWIIGIVCITPKPVYSQQLNKQLLKTELLDYYFPEFAHIGFQPIFNREIAPLQCTDDDGSRLMDVFGYQRAWYEYLANVDEVHGDFRTSMRHYLINRIFNNVPQLSSDFLTVSPDEVNQVFAVEEDSDKIFGQIYFDVKMKRPIPAIGVPKLEVG